MTQHKAIGRLHGRAEPRQDILDRLYDLNRDYVVGWIPPGAPQKDHKGRDYQRPAMWRIYERRPNVLKQSAGMARLQRFERWPDEKKAANPGIVYQSEEDMDGLHIVAEFSEDYFGTDRMFQDLIQGELELRAFQEDLRKAQGQAAEDAAIEEMEQNSEYAEFVGEVAKDFYNRVKGNAVVGYSPSTK
jgi:hypothetical protein